MRRINNIATWLWKRRFGVLIIITLLAANDLTAQPYREGYFKGITTIDDAGTGPKRITTIVDAPSSNGTPLQNLITEFYLQQSLAGLELSGGNAMEVKNVRDYGAVPDAVVPASGSLVTGTNNRTAFINAYSNTPRGGVLFVPAGNWRVEGGLGTWSTKDVIFIQAGNVYTNKTSYITLGAPGGPDRVWSLLIYGKIIGQVNIPTNSLTTRGNGTSPKWNLNFTGTGITLLPNVNNSHIKVKWIEGMFKAVEIQGGGGGGSQENTIAFERFWYNAIGISLRNTDGVGWTDKNHFKGWDNGCGRITGGLAVKIDMFSGAASTNGEIFNGAARSNEFKFLAERIDSLVEANGDVTYNHFEITPEAGSSTGVLGATNVIVCRKTAPNVVRNNKWTGTGILNSPWLAQGLGIDDEIQQMVYLNNSVLVGYYGEADATGAITMQVKGNLTKVNRDALAAINIKCVNKPVPMVVRTITTVTGTSTYTDDNGLILLNSSTMAFTPGPASSNVGITINVKNINANNSTLFTVSGKATLAQNEAVQIKSNGVAWTALTTGYSYTPPAP